jgi:glycosyltransferase A (GT-A) superfamily protein (DUF2064 family)
MTLEQQATAFCEALNARAAEMTAKLGRKPTYHNFGFELGRKYARIFWSTDSGQRSALAFVDADGVVRRSDSWKAAGRILGRRDAVEVIAFVGGPL